MGQSDNGRVAPRQVGHDRSYGRWVGLLALFSGLALLLEILAGVSLRIGLAVGGLGAIAGLGTALARQDRTARRVMKSHLSVGVIAGIAATVVYDLAKYALSLVDRSGFNPFGAMEVFGVLIAGESAARGAVMAAGIGFHVLNGVLFGLAYVLLFGRRGVMAGIAWGLFLEIFQVTLYPGWLDIAAYREFLTISALGHVAYGATLGGVSRHLLSRHLSSARS